MSNENGMAPGQVIKVLVGVVVGLVVAIWLLAKLATGGYNVDAEVMTKEAVAARLKPVGEAKVSDAPPGMRTGEQVFKAICISCHGQGLAGSPKFGDAGAWGARIKQGFDALVNSALKGKGAMGAQGGGDFSDIEIARAIVFMANQSGASFKEPAEPKAKAAANVPADLAGAPDDVKASAAAPISTGMCSYSMPSSIATHSARKARVRAMP